MNSVFGEQFNICDKKAETEIGKVDHNQTRQIFSYPSPSFRD